MSDEEVQNYAPPTRKRSSPLPPDKALSYRPRHAASDRGERSRHSREKRRFKVPFKPDYAVNPSKWTKYDLMDDGTKELGSSGMNAEQVNKYAAFEFLKQQKELRKGRSEGYPEEEEESEGKVVFKKPTKECGRRGRSGGMGVESSGGVGTMRGGGGVSVMPEYVVGGEKEKVKRGRKKLLVLGGRLDKEVEEDVKEQVRNVGEKKGRCVGLSHLEEEERE